MDLFGRETAICVCSDHGATPLGPIFNPADALKQMANLLQPGGSLLVTDLCSHNQNWAREACGDLWLGFEQDDLARWATAAGLVPGESLYVGLRNGFQIQVRHFQRPAGDTHHR